MRIIVTILTCLGVNILFAQNSFDELREKAFDFYNSRSQPDSALHYYQQISLRFPNTREAYTNHQIAGCYLQTGGIDSAEKYYLLSLSINKHFDSLGFSQTRSCFSLSKIYYDRKQFREALTYLKYTKTKYRPLIRLCEGTHGGYEGNLTFAYKKSLCYSGLERKDSAISELAPFIFRPVSDVYIDSAEYEAITRYFVKTVFEVYGKQKARDELSKATKNLVYTPVYRENEEYKSIFIEVHCIINFANTSINLNMGGGCQVQKKGEIPEYFSKDTLLKEFFDSPAYKYIMYDESPSITKASSQKEHTE